MSNISIIERMVAAYAKGEPMPLKGHAKIIFADALTGKIKEVMEEDNLITNAVASVFAHNYCGLANFSKMLPLKRMYAGVAVFQNAMTESANGYNPPDDITNPMVAHAGPDMNSTASKLRGNPVVSDFVTTDTSIKQVWSWDETHGVGTWGCICLVPEILGNMGLKPFDTAYHPIINVGIDTNYTTDFSETISKQYPLSIESDGQTAKTVWASGTTFKEYTIRHDYLKHGIMRGARTWQDVSNRTATIRSFDNNCFIFQDASYYYVAKAVYDSQNSKYGLRIDKISKADMTVTQADIYYDTITLYVGNMNCYYRNCISIWGFDGTYLYYPNSAGTSFVRMNIVDNSDKMELSGTLSISTGSAPGSSVAGAPFMTPVAISEGVILGHNYLINGGSAYQIKTFAGQLGYSDGTYGDESGAWAIRDGAAMYMNSKQRYWTDRSAGQGNMLCEMFLSTINNMSESHVKQTSETARIEYTLTEV